MFQEKNKKLSMAIKRARFLSLMSLLKKINIKMKVILTTNIKLREVGDQVIVRWICKKFSISK